MRYRAQWRRPYRHKAKISATGVLLKAVKLYKRGVQKNDTEALLDAQRLLSVFDRYTETIEQGRR